jgi:cytochrome b subunit of formate dehydrogenase
MHSDFISEPLPLWTWVLASMGVIMLGMIIIGFVYYRRAQFETQLNAMNWLIKWEDVSMNEKKDPRKAKKVKDSVSIIRNVFFFFLCLI